MVERFLAQSFTETGASHIRKGTVCQDSSVSKIADGYCYCAVSDGHGGDSYFRSDRGSGFAVRAFCECVEQAFSGGSESSDDSPNLSNKAKNFYEAILSCATEKQVNERLFWLARSVVMRWNALVEEDLSAEPFSESELEKVSQKTRQKYQSGEYAPRAYGATLIGAVVTEDFWFGLHIGDGKCVVFDRSGEPREPIPWDERCFLNITTSICDTDAAQEFRFFFEKSPPAAIFVGSDGIDDSFSTTLRLHNFYRVILSSFASEDELTAAADLKDYLPTLSSQGSGDDMSVGCIIDIDHIRSNSKLYEKKKEPFLRVYRMGDLGAEKPTEFYAQKKEIDAVSGTVYLTALGLSGFQNGIDRFEIAAADNDKITVHINGGEHIITPDSPAIIICSEQPLDCIIIQCIMR